MQVKKKKPHFASHPFTLLILELKCFVSQRPKNPKTEIILHNSIPIWAGCRQAQESTKNGATHLFRVVSIAVPYDNLKFLSYKADIHHPFSSHPSAEGILCTAHISANWCLFVAIWFIITGPGTI